MFVTACVSSSQGHVRVINPRPWWTQQDFQRAHPSLQRIWIACFSPLAEAHGAVHGPLRKVYRQLVTETLVQAKSSDFKPQPQHLAFLSCLLGMLNSDPAQVQSSRVWVHVSRSTFRKLALLKLRPLRLVFAGRSLGASTDTDTDTTNK